MLFRSVCPKMIDGWMQGPLFSCLPHRTPPPTLPPHQLSVQLCPEKLLNKSGLNGTEVTTPLPRASHASRHILPTPRYPALIHPSQTHWPSPSQVEQPPPQHGIKVCKVELYTVLPASSPRTCLQNFLPVPRSLLTGLWAFVFQNHRARRDLETHWGKRPGEGAGPWEPHPNPIELRPGSLREARDLPLQPHSLTETW